jgi:hypothetical protein
MVKSINLGNQIIMFGSSKCPACVAQIKLLNDYFSKKGSPLLIKYFNLDKHDPPSFLLDSSGNYSMPSWYSPKSKKITQGMIRADKFVTIMGIKRKNKFGNWTPEIDPLVKYGKNFPNNKGFEIENSFENEMTKKWGNPLNSGTLGREFGPGNTDNAYKSAYFNDIRMARPGGDLDSLDFLNRSCNLVNNSKLANDTKDLGFLYDAKDRQLNSNNFGKKLYYQMGPAYAYNNEYLVDKNTVNSLYGGALQGEPPRPLGVLNKKMFIGNQPEYTPLKKGNLVIPPYINEFGLKAKKKLISPYPKRSRNKVKKINEGDILTLKNNKIKVIRK